MFKYNTQCYFLCLACGSSKKYAFRVRKGSFKTYKERVLLYVASIFLRTSVGSSVFRLRFLWAFRSSRTENMQILVEEGVSEKYLGLSSLKHNMPLIWESCQQKAGKFLFSWLHMFNILSG